MTLQFLKILVINEIRLRARRISSLVALLAVSFLSWSVIADPNNGHAMLVVNDTRVLYNSTALALGTSSLASPLFCLIGFFLVRGRVAEDLRSGIAGVIGASPVSNTSFLLARWLGGVAYLTLLCMAYLAMVMVCHLIRGEGPVELSVYLITYGLLLMPMVFFSVSCAILFDSFAFLMGKFGDVLYFVVWAMLLAQITILSEETNAQLSPLLALDFSGLVMSTLIFTSQMMSNNVSIGMSTFDAKLTPITMQHVAWSAEIIGLRLTTFLLSVVPLIPAMLFFHRYNPDRVKVSNAQQRRSPLAVLNQFLRPLARVVSPLFRLASFLPGMAGQVVADIALLLASSPSVILVFIIGNLIGLFIPLNGIIASLVFSSLVWGIAISDISTRDFSADCTRLTGVVIGGVAQRYVRHVFSAALLGMLLSGSVLLRLLAADPLHAFILMVGIVSLAAVATLLGRTSSTPRTFLSLFLFWWYLATQTPKEALMDVMGFNGAANLSSMSWHASIGLIALVLGLLYNRWRSEAH